MSNTSRTTNNEISELTVLMTVYHKVAPKHLDEALNSLWQQTRPAAQVILVEDGTLPGPLEEVVVKHEHAHENLMVLRYAANRGSGCASNDGFAEVATEWVARLDSDDIAAKERFEKQWAAIEAAEAAGKPLDVVGSALAEFEGDITEVIRVRRLPQKHADIAKYTRMNSPINNPAAMIRTSLVRGVGGYRDVPYMEDYDLWARLLARGGRFENLPEPLTFFRADGMFERRRAQGIFRSEMRMQKILRELGLVSYPRSVFNLCARTAFRLLPTTFMRSAYKYLFSR